MSRIARLAVGIGGALLLGLGGLVVSMVVGEQDHVGGIVAYYFCKEKCLSGRLYQDSEALLAGASPEIRGDARTHLALFDASARVHMKGGEEWLAVKARYVWPFTRDVRLSDGFDCVKGEADLRR